MANTSLSQDTLAFCLASCRTRSIICPLKLLVGAQVLENICQQAALFCALHCEGDIVGIVLWTGRPCVPDGSHIALVTLLKHSHTNSAFWFLRYLQVAENEGTVEANQGEFAV